jgi:K+-sensing histidine kinase KdpD
MEPDKKMQLDTVMMVVAILLVAIYVSQIFQSGWDWKGILGLILSVFIFAVFLIDALQISHAKSNQG